MTLIPLQNKKPDTRMIEYDQAVVRLGMEKVRLESEVEKGRKNLKEINTAYDLVRSVFVKKWERLTEEEKKEVTEKKLVLMDFDKQILDKEKAVNSLIKKHKKVTEDIKGVEDSVVVRQKVVTKLEERESKIKEDLVKLEEVRHEKEQGALNVKHQLKERLEELRDIESVVKNISRNKVEMDLAVEKSQRELKELNEIISILQATNKQGLDLVASFEGERNRLKEKEEALIRKEKDLDKYAGRVEKMRKELGINIPMIFK